MSRKAPICHNRVRHWSIVPIAALLSVAYTNIALAGVSTDVHANVSWPWGSPEWSSSNNATNTALVQATTSGTYEVSQPHFVESANQSYYDYAGSTNFTLSGSASASGYSTLGALHGVVNAASGAGVASATYGPATNFSAPATQYYNLVSTSYFTGQWNDTWSFDVGSSGCASNACTVTVMGHVDFNAQLNPVLYNLGQTGGYGGNFQFNAYQIGGSNGTTRDIRFQDSVFDDVQTTTFWSGENDYFQVKDHIELGNPDGSHSVAWTASFSIPAINSSSFSVWSYLYLDASMGGSISSLGTGAIDGIWLPDGVTMSSLEGTLITQGNGSLNYLQALAPVPEPESYMMILAGLGLVGAITRRRTSKHI